MTSILLCIHADCKQQIKAVRWFSLQVEQRKISPAQGLRTMTSLDEPSGRACKGVCVRVNTGLVQVIVHRGEGAGADASSCHDGEALGGLTHSLGQGGLLGEVVSLWRRETKNSRDVRAQLPF